MMELLAGISCHINPIVTLVGYLNNAVLKEYEKYTGVIKGQSVNYFSFIFRERMDSLVSKVTWVSRAIR